MSRGDMTSDEAASTLPPILAAKARNPLQVELATILAAAEKSISHHATSNGG